jgi:hypothetical protein
MLGPYKVCQPTMKKFISFLIIVIFYTMFDQGLLYFFGSLEDGGRIGLTITFVIFAISIALLFRGSSSEK